MQAYIDNLQNLELTLFVALDQVRTDIHLVQSADSRALADTERLVAHVHALVMELEKELVTLVLTTSKRTSSYWAAPH